MNTPIADFVRGYVKKNMTRFHMPGHKGTSVLGCEAWDITEVKGADSLYEAEGIIAESEKNASMIFGTAGTFYSTEGSSQCIKAMLHLALCNYKGTGKPVVIAARNVHKAFVYAAALLDIEVVWLWPEEEMNSLCSCHISETVLEKALQQLEEPPAAVYVTSPDYLGGTLDVEALAITAHKYHTILLVDNAHGAYLHFLKKSLHPIALGADLCCDSAHKTLPVLTGGAYLHVSEQMANVCAQVKSALGIYGSTSPSYLTLSSLDMCNAYLADGYKSKLDCIINEINETRSTLQQHGWKVSDSEPLKITVEVPENLTGTMLAELLRKHQIECEYADPEFIVFMFTPENTAEELKSLTAILNEIVLGAYTKTDLQYARCRKKTGIREALFSYQEEVPVEEAVGRICGAPAVSCPPAIPIVVSGEIVDETALALFKHYGISTLYVMKE